MRYSRSLHPDQFQKRTKQEFYDYMLEECWCLVHGMGSHGLEVTYMRDWTQKSGPCKKRALFSNSIIKLNSYAISDSRIRVWCAFKNIVTWMKGMSWTRPTCAEYSSSYHIRLDWIIVCERGQLLFVVLLRVKLDRTVTQNLPSGVQLIVKLQPNETQIFNVSSAHWSLIPIKRRNYKNNCYTVLCWRSTESLIIIIGHLRCPM